MIFLWKSSTKCSTPTRIRSKTWSKWAKSLENHFLWEKVWILKKSICQQARLFKKNRPKTSKVRAFFVKSRN